MLNFPDSPTTNQVFQNWMWDGTKWVSTAAAAAGFPSGTVMLFYQAGAPVGWTQQTTQNDKLLRVVSGSTGGTAGGTNNFSGINSAGATGLHTLLVAELPTVYSYPPNNYYFPVSTGAWAAVNVSGGSGYYASYTSGSQTYYNYVSANGVASQAHQHALNLNIAYCDMIIASKN